MQNTLDLGAILRGVLSSLLSSKIAFPYYACAGNFVGGREAAWACAMRENELGGDGDLGVCYTRQLKCKISYCA